MTVAGTIGIEKAIFIEKHQRQYMLDRGLPNKQSLQGHFCSANRDLRGESGESGERHGAG